MTDENKKNWSTKAHLDVQMKIKWSHLIGYQNTKSKLHAQCIQVKNIELATTIYFLSKLTWGRKYAVFRDTVAYVTKIPCQHYFSLKKAQYLNAGE
jgi:hypothetical protein